MFEVSFFASGVVPGFGCFGAVYVRLVFSESGEELPNKEAKFELKTNLVD